MNCTSDSDLARNCTSFLTVINTTLIYINSTNNNLLSTELQNDYNTTSLQPDPWYRDFRDQSRFWIQRVLVPIIMIIGVIGNSITIVIMTRRKMRSSTNSYLAALATFDMSYLIVVFILSLSHYPNIKDIKFYIYWYLWPFAIMLTDASSNTSIWLTVTFTIERYIAVCHPIKGKVLCTESRAKRVILCVFIICFTFTIPTPFEWTVLEKFNSTTNKTYLDVTFSDFGKNDLYKTVYYYLNVILFILIPFLLLAIFNAFLIHSVHISSKQRNTMTQGDISKPDPTSKQESRITIMLIAVVILFFLCQIPTACVLIYSVFYTVEEYTNKGLLIRGLGNIFNFLMAINSAGNFVLYSLLSQKYRRTFVEIFCPCFKEKFLNTQSGYNRTVYTQVGDHNIQFNHRFNYNPNTTRRLSSPRGRTYLANQGFGTGRLSSGSLSPYSAQNNSSIRCSRSANYLQVPTGSSSNLMYDSSASISPSSSGEEDNSFRTDSDKNNKNIFDANQQNSMNDTNLNNNNNKNTDIIDPENMLDLNGGKVNKILAENCDQKLNSGVTKNGSAIILSNNNDEESTVRSVDSLNQDSGQVCNNTNNLGLDVNKILTTAVVNNTSNL